MATDPNKVVLLDGGEQEAEISLLDILDHILNSGVVIQGSLVISLGGVDLVYIGLNAVLTSVESALKYIEAEPRSDQKKLRS